MKFGCIILLMVLAITANAQKAAIMLQNGNESYQKKEFVKAVNQYREALKNDPDNSILLFNLGNALYKSGNLDEASKAFEKAVGKASEKQFTAKAFYNEAVALFGMHKFREAALAFKKALKLNPLDKDCRENLQMSINELKKESESSQKGEGEKNKTDKDNQDKKQDNSKAPINKEAGEKLLNDLQKQEQRLKDSLQKLGKGNKVNSGKDW